MKIIYDFDANAVYIKLKPGKSYKTKELDGYTILDYNKKGKLIGIELLFTKSKKRLCKNIRSLEILLE